MFFSNASSAPRLRHSHLAASLTRATLLGGTALVLLLGAGGGAWAQVTVGANSKAAVNSVAVGDGAKAGYNDQGAPVDSYAAAVAIGANADAESRAAVAIGSGSKVGSGGGVAIDGQTNGGLAIGGNAYGGLYGGAASVAGSANGSETVAVGVYSQAGYRVVAKKDDDGAFKEMDGNYYVYPVMNATALGARSVALGNNSVAIGMNSAAASDYSIAIGIGQRDWNENSGAFGQGSIAIGQNAVAGMRTVVNQGVEGAVLIGDKWNLISSNPAAIAIGQGASAQASYSMAIGPGANANNGGVALGLNSATDVYDNTNSEQSKLALTNQTYGAATISNSFAGTGGTIRVLSVGNASMQTYSQIQNVAAGRLTANSTDAVNGSQLWAVMQSIVGGGGGGGGALPSGGGGAGAGAGSSVPIGTASGENALALGTGSSAGANSVALGANSTTGAAVEVAGDTVGGKYYAYQGAKPVGVVSVGSAGNERQVQNVAAGRVAANSTDAVNGSQLWASNQAINAAIDSLGSSINQLNNRVGSVQKEARGGIAAAVALVNAPMPSQPGKTSWAGNVAKFRDQYAMGMSLSHRLNSNIPLAMTAGFAYTPGTSDVTGRFGMAGEF